MKYILPIVLSLCVSANAQTLIFPVSDLLMQIPDFSNAPAYNFWNGMYGQVPVGEKANSVSRRKLENELIELMWEEYPDAKSIKIFNGNLIIKL